MLAGDVASVAGLTNRLCEKRPMNTASIVAAEPTPQERWRAVVGYEGFYEVSDHGRVRSLDRWYAKPVSRRHPTPWERCYPGKIISLSPNSGGYPRVILHRRRNRKEVLVHWLVLEAFVGPCPAGQEGLHWNDIKTDNRLSNLRWGTRSDNVKDARRNGRGFPFSRIGRQAA